MSFAAFCLPSAVSTPAAVLDVDSAPDVVFAEWTGDDSAPETPPQSTRTVATVCAPRKELLDRLRTAGKGDAVRLAINGSVDLSILFGSVFRPERQGGIDASGQPSGDMLPAGFSPPETSLELRDNWERSGELAEVIPAQRLAAILAKAKGDDLVKLELYRDSATGERGCIVRTGRSEFTLATDEAEFPVSDAPDTDSVVLVDSAELLRALAQTEYATDCESTRYALGGILVELTETGITCAATDSRRLAKISVSSTPADGFQPGSGVIPWQAANLIAQQCKKSPGPVAVAIGANRFAAESESWTVAGMLVDGRFPDYRKIIPTRFSALVKLDRAEFLESLETIQLATDEESRGVYFTFHADRLELLAKTNSGCAGRVEMLADLADEAGDGVTHTIAFDPRYLAEYVKRQTGECVVMAIIDSGTPCVLECDGGATYVLMPLSRDR